MCSLSERRGEAGTAGLARPRGQTGIWVKGEVLGWLPPSCTSPSPCHQAGAIRHRAGTRRRLRAERCCRWEFPTIREISGTCRKSSQGLAFVLGPKGKTRGKRLVLSQISNFLVCFFVCLIFISYSNSKMKHSELP